MSFYELTNEPVKGGPHWGAPEQYTDKVLADLKSVYLIMRRKAPDTHIVLFTTANIWPDCASWAALIAKVQELTGPKHLSAFIIIMGRTRSVRLEYNVYDRSTLFS
ncbi:MAG: hypothetical protein IPK78_10715 [Rhodospirillales bacterium]|nr:hypothetical protein [Rhodospirillales bacterium]